MTRIYLDPYEAPREETGWIREFSAPLLGDRGAVTGAAMFNRLFLSRVFSTLRRVVGTKRTGNETRRDETRQDEPSHHRGGETEGKGG